MTVKYSLLYINDGSNKGSNNKHNPKDQQVLEWMAILMVDKGLLF